MTKDQFYEELNSRLNYCIGRLLVGRSETRHPDVIAVHEKLLETAHWVDESFEEIEAEAQ